MEASHLTCHSDEHEHPNAFHSSTNSISSVRLSVRSDWKEHDGTDWKEQRGTDWEEHDGTDSRADGSDWIWVQPWCQEVKYLYLKKLSTLFISRGIPKYVEKRAYEWDQKTNDPIIEGILRAL